MKSSCLRATLSAAVVVAFQASPLAQGDVPAVDGYVNFNSHTLSPTYDLWESFQVSPENAGRVMLSVRKVSDSLWYPALFGVKLGDPQVFGLYPTPVGWTVAGAVSGRAPTSTQFPFGDATGYSDGGGATSARPILWPQDSSGFVPIPMAGFQSGTAKHISNSGSVAGYFDTVTGGRRPFVYNALGTQVLLHPAYNFGVADFVDDLGVVYGHVFNSGQPSYIARWQPNGSGQYLADPFVYINTAIRPWDIARSGYVTGAVNYQDVVPGVMIFGYMEPTATLPGRPFVYSTHEGFLFLGTDGELGAPLHWFMGSPDNGDALVVGNGPSMPWVWRGRPRGLLSPTSNIADGVASDLNAYTIPVVKASEVRPTSATKLTGLNSWLTLGGVSLPGGRDVWLGIRDLAWNTAAFTQLTLSQGMKESGQDSDLASRNGQFVTFQRFIQPNPNVPLVQFQVRAFADTTIENYPVAFRVTSRIAVTPLRIKIQPYNWLTQQYETDPLYVRDEPLQKFMQSFDVYVGAADYAKFVSASQMKAQVSVYQAGPILNSGDLDYEVEMANWLVRAPIFGE